MQGRVIRQPGLSLPTDAIRNFCLQPGNLGSAMPFKNQEGGKEAYRGKKSWVVSTVVVSKGLSNPSVEMFGVFLLLFATVCT